MKTLTLAITATMLIFTACSNQEQVKHISKDLPIKKKIKKKKHTYKKVPKPPKKHVKLKKVEDENFSSDYMYPTTKKSKPKAKAKPKIVYTENKETNQTKKVVAVVPKSSAMTENECISMIGKDKFDKYTQMYGDSNAALKKCKMLKEL